MKCTSPRARRRGLRELNPLAFKMAIGSVSKSGSLAIFAAILRASPLPLADLILTLLLVGFRRQTPNNYSHREHEGPRN
jgi:hypothetical protein